MTKTFILDTNVLISDPKCLNNFQDNDLVIPILVLEELDKHKSRSDEVGRSCREVSRYLDDLITGGDVRNGVSLPSGGTMQILSSRPGYTTKLPPELTSGSSVDNMILGFVLDFKSQEPDKTVILVSKDINIRIKSATLGIEAQDYLSMRVSDSVDTLYTGVKVIHTKDDLIDDFYKGGRYKVSDVTSDTTYPNQIVVLKAVDENGNTLNSALARRMQDGSLDHLVKYDNVFGLHHRNKEQNFSFNLLMDPRVKLVTLTGKAGCGKTLIAMAAGLEQLESMGNNGTYKKLIVSRPVQPVGRDIGFLPGTMEEKMEPWVSPIRDSLEFLLGASGLKKLESTGGTRRRTKKSEESSGGFQDPYLELMKQKGLIEIEAISFIRGRSIPNAFIIIDEAQNLSIHELKTIITRAGEGTKIVLTGDIEQIDNVHVDTFTNGLTYAVERFKDYDIAGHITLLKGERSELATLASKIL
jgi:PhoH-like ATPase